jgi:dTDP-4-dehydrorhamnose 3,5-epimerase
MIKKPNKIPGDKIFDNRGSLSFVNSFGFNGVKRFYLIQNHQKNFIRAWHGHKLESKLIFMSKGSGIVAAVLMSDTVAPDKTAPVYRFAIDSESHTAIYIPAGYSNGLMSLTTDAHLLVFSNTTLSESLGDDYRFPYDYWNPWEVTPR